MFMFMFLFVRFRSAQWNGIKSCKFTHRTVVGIVDSAVHMTQTIVEAERVDDGINDLQGNDPKRPKRRAVAATQ